MGKKRGGRRGKAPNAPEEQPSKPQAKPETAQEATTSRGQQPPPPVQKQAPPSEEKPKEPALQQPLERVQSQQAWGRGRPSRQQVSQEQPRPVPPVQKQSTPPKAEKPVIFQLGEQSPQAWGRGRPSRQQVSQEQPKPVPPIQKKSPPPNTEKQITFPPGTLGRKIKIETNHLQLNLGNLRQVYRYDVSVEPDKPKKLLTVAMNLFRSAHFSDNYPSYDGQKLLFSAKKLPLKDDKIEGSVTMKNENDRDMTFKITIKLSGTLDLSPLHNLLQKNIGFDAFQCVEVVFRQAYASSFIGVGRRFFTPPKIGEFPLGGGAQMYLGGCQAAVRGWKPLLNVDVTHKAFTLAIPIKDLILEMFSTRNLQLTEQNLKTLDLRPWQLEQLEKYLKGFKILYQIPNHSGSKKVYRINGLKNSACREAFMYNNESITIENYYRTRWHYTLKYPNLPTIWVGGQDRQIVLPLECCTLQPGQPIDCAKMMENQTSKIIRYAATTTQDRKAKIKNIIHQAGYNRNRCIEEFGFSVADDFEKIDARILDPPELKYSNGKVEPKKGTWRGRKYIEGAEINKWVIVGVGVQRERVNADLHELAKMIVEFGRNNGMSFSNPEPFDFIRGDYRSLVAYLEKKKTYDLIIAIIPPFNKDQYHLIKQAAELSVGCLTQCIKAETLRKLRQTTIENILLKINSKLNGINHILCDLNLITAEPCMVMGADVTHPSPQAKTIPSVVAVTASHDLHAAKYNVCTRLQKPRTTMSEMIQDLKEITVTKLKFFKAKTNKEPRRIYFFRDGVSDGEFDRVTKVEVEALVAACDAFRKGYRPKITFLVVQKRHHTRLFPLDQRDSEDKNCNVPAGTCVDTVITDPTMQNFYLVSHASIQGVARPTKYCTLYDENGLNNDDVQKLTYYLCHLFVRCNRTVSYPAPTYYAHLAADRAKGYLYGKTINMDQLNPKLIQTKEQFAANNPMFFS